MNTNFQCLTQTIYSFLNGGGKKSPEISIQGGILNIIIIRKCKSPGKEEGEEIGIEEKQNKSMKINLFVL